MYNINIMDAKFDILKSNFIKRGYNFSYFNTSAEAIQYILSLIPKNKSIGFGGSVTVKESGLLDALIDSQNYKLLHRDICPEIPQEELYSLMHNADWYIASTNALCMTGDLVNIDGRANRVAAMLNGPKNVIIVCGVNKIVNDIQAGIDRTRNVASPPNCRRLNKKTPCAVTGVCSYCNSPDTICKATVIQHHPTTDSSVYVVLINQNLGY